MKRLAIVCLSLLFISSGLWAQEMKKVDNDERYIPISREQAEELITKMILEIRLPEVKARETERMVRDFKIETLKRRLLEQALRDSYMDEYRERMDRMERLLMTLIASQSEGKVDPTIIHTLVTQAAAPQVTAPQLGTVPPQAAAATPSPEWAELINLLKAQGDVSQAQLDAISKHLHEVSTEPSLENEDELTSSLSTCPMRQSEKVFFKVGSAALSPEAQRTLDNVVSLALMTPEMKFKLKGYASPEGNLSANNALSEKRIKSVAAYIESKGVTPSRLILIPSGIDSMKANNKDARRVEIFTVR